jgi:hypothetical protein
MNINHDDNERQLMHLTTNSSEGSGVTTSEPLSASCSVIAYDANHFVELGADLNAARESAIRGLGTVRSHHSILLK